MLGHRASKKIKGLTAITTAPDGALWFINGSDSIGRITTSGVVTTFIRPKLINQVTGVPSTWMGCESAHEPSKPCHVIVSDSSSKKSPWLSKVGRPAPSTAARRTG